MLKMSIEIPILMVINEHNLLKPPFPKKGQVTHLLICDPIKRRTFTVELVRDNEHKYQITGIEWDEYAQVRMWGFHILF